MSERQFDPTPEQRAIIAAEDRDFVVLAAAGSGKTSVLTQRYLRHVEEGISPDRILTITFTRKAAAEMKERIVSSLRAQSKLREAQLAETGPIQTIHSFCERLLRENALEAGMDPKFEILTEAAASRLLLQCIREAIAAPLEGEPEAEATIRFLAGKRKFTDRVSPYARLENAVAEVLNKMRTAGASPLVLANRHRSPAELIAAWEEALIGAAPTEVRDAMATIDGASVRERLQKAYKAVTNRTPSWLRGPQEPEAEREAAIHTCGLVQLASDAWWRLDREMNAMQALDFTELEKRGVHLLQNSEATRDRLREQVSVVMVDEAQDLNPQQYLLLQGLSPLHQMRVGDPQQSIYGFRQADRGLFVTHAGEVSTLELSKNWRSEPGILRFVDRVFGNWWGADYRPMLTRAFDWDDVSCDGVEIWRHAAQDTYATAEYIQELIRVDGESPDKIAILVRDARYAGQMRDCLLKHDIPCRIHGGSERFYTRIEVRDLANALRAVADPQDDFALLACLRSPMVGLSLDSIVALGLESNVAARLATFEPPVPDDIARLGQFVEWFLPLSAYADRLSAWEVLAEIFARSGYLASLARRERGDQMLANARKLLTLAAQEPEMGPLEYADRIREIQDLRHKEGDAPAGPKLAEVSIMTIHKAKGLEFEVVVLPQTTSRLASNASDLLVDANAGLVATKFGKDACLMHKFLAESAKADSIQEELRVLYVAMTRAKRRLCICLYNPTTHDTPSKRLGQLLKEPWRGIRVRESSPAAAREH